MLTRALALRYSNSSWNSRVKNAGNISQVYLFAPKLVGYHSNFPWATAKRISNYFIILAYSSTTAENLVKIGRVYSEIFGLICQFCRIFHTDEQLYLRSYWSEAHQILNAVKAPIDIAIFLSVSKCQSDDLPRNWLPLSDQKKVKSIMYDPIPTIW